MLSQAILTFVDALIREVQPVELNLHDEMLSGMKVPRRKRFDVPIERIRFLLPSLPI